MDDMPDNYIYRRDFSKLLEKKYSVVQNVFVCCSATCSTCCSVKIPHNWNKRGQTFSITMPKFHRNRWMCKNSSGLSPDVKPTRYLWMNWNSKKTIPSSPCPTSAADLTNAHAPEWTNPYSLVSQNQLEVAKTKQNKRKAQLSVT